jgi:hypothetical protein
MAKRREKSTALVPIAPDAEQFASDLEDLESMSQKAIGAELRAKKAHDFIRRYRRWRNGMLDMEAKFWAEAAEILGDPPPPSIEVEEEEAE